MSVPPYSLAAIRQPALMYGPNGRVAAANDLAEALAGRQLAGLSDAEVIRTFRHRWPDGTPLPLAELPAHRAFAGEEAVDVPLVITVADGRELDILATASPVREGDAIVGTLVIWQDVTERRRAEEEMRANEERFHALYEHSRDAIILSDPGDGGRILSANPAACRMLGYSEEEMAGRSGREAILDPDSPETGRSVRERERAGTAPVEQTYRRRDGSTFSGEVSTSLFTDSRGAPRAVSIIRDVTGRKRAEAELARYAGDLRESRQELADVIAATGAGYYRLTLDEPAGIVSPRGAEILGFAIPEMPSLLGVIAEAGARMYPDDFEGVINSFMAFVEAGSERNEVEFRVRAPEGGWRWVQAIGTSAQRDSAGRVVTLAGFLFDIDARKKAEEALAESEEKYRNLVDLAPDAILIHQDGMIVFANPAAAALTGVGGPDDLVGEPVLEIVHPETRRHVAWNIETDLRGDESPLTAVDLLRPDGTTVTVQGRGAMIPFGGRPAVQVVLRDVTEEKRADAERARFTEELQRSNEELQRFAYVASHDLQEPLRSIVSFSQLLERRYAGQLDEDANEFIGFIIEGGNRMQQLIQDLLQLSRIETKARPLASTDVVEVVAGVVRSMETPIREAGATVTVEPLPRVMADAAQLAQVFTNLVGNALKYRRPGVPPTIRISAEPAGRFWRFAVADNGIGIEKEYFGRIFIIFQRLHTREEYGGTGIGLAIVRKIVDRHGGRVWVESTPGEGSTFFFTLPAA
jgi:PAS domain S-box-containing protein